jgi:hypothetical protein
VRRSGGLQRLQQRDLGGQVGGQGGEGDGVGVAVQLDPLGRGLQPRRGLGSAVHPLADRSDELGERVCSLRHQGPGIAPGAQDLQVDPGDPGRERRSGGRHQLAGQVADADLAGGDLLGQPLGHPHLMVLFGGQASGQLDRPQRLALQDGDAGQGGRSMRLVL